MRSLVNDYNNNTRILKTQLTDYKSKLTKMEKIIQELNEEIVRNKMW
jgi:prefoldin subunit 5